MDVAVVGPTYPVPGGVAAHTTELAHRLAAAGHDTRLLGWQRPYPGRLYPGDTRGTPPPDLPEFPRTARALRWDRPRGWWRAGAAMAGADLSVLVHVMPVQVPVLRTMLAAHRRARERGGVPAATVLLCHNVLPHERHVADAAMVSSLLRQAGAVLVHTSVQADLARSLGARDVRVAALPPHLPAGLRPSSRPRRDGPVRLLALGMVRRYKGVDVLLQAMRDVPGCTLTVAGEEWGDAGRAVRELAASPGLAGRVLLRPGYVPVDDVSVLLAEHDVLALPYRSGTASQNVDLAFAAGLPVLATRTGSFASRVTDGVDGLMAEPDDVASLTDALHRLVRSGTVERLRAGVRPPDVDAAWAGYLAALVPRRADEVSSARAPH